MDSNDALIVFEGAKIRRRRHNEQLYFLFVDIVGALTDSSIPRRYRSDFKIKLDEERFQLSEIIGQLKIEAYEKLVRLKITRKTEVLS